MRSLFAGVAVGWFIYNALTFIPQGAALVMNDGQVGGIDGDPGAVAITWAARTLFAGLALVALALIDWAGIARVFSGQDEDQPEPSDLTTGSPAERV